MAAARHHRRTATVLAIGAFAAAWLCGEAIAFGTCGPPQLSMPGQSGGYSGGEPRVIDEVVDPEAESQAIDAALFFQQLVQRYRSLRMYEDRATLVEITQRDGQQPQRRESHLRCEITDAGELKIRTPKSAALSNLGLDIPFRRSEPMREAQRSFGLWLAPHLGLRFWDDPLRELRSAAGDNDEQPLQPKRAMSVKVGDRAVVQLELGSNEDADADGEDDAEFDLYVDPQSMLVERVEGRERLSDGASYETTLEITSATARAQDGEPIELPTQTDEPQTIGSDPPTATDAPQPWDEPATDEPASAPPAGPGSTGQGSAGQGSANGEPAGEEPDDAPSAPPTMRFPQ